MTTKIYPADLIGKENFSHSWQSKWAVSEQITASGRRRTMTTQLLPEWTISLNYPHLNREKMQILLGFFNSCRGSHQSFFYRDYEKNHMEKQILMMDPITGNYQCVADYSGSGFYEPVFRVENVHVFIDDVETENFTVKDGVIKVLTPGTVTASYDYSIRCYFKNDGITVRQNFFNSYGVSVNLGIDR